MKKMSLKVDKRFLRSDKLILRALVISLHRKHTVSIKVIDLCRIAKIATSTFYRHYRNVDEVVENYEEKLRRKIHRKMTRLSPTTVPRKIFRNLLLLIYQDRIYFKIALEREQVQILKDIIQGLTGFQEIARCCQNMSPMKRVIFEHEILGLITMWGEQDNFDLDLVEYYAFQINQLCETAPRRLNWLSSRESLRQRAKRVTCRD